MSPLQWQLNEKGRGTLSLNENGEQIGKMDLAVQGKDLVVYHTEVASKAEGRGLGKVLLTELVAYARANGLKVVPLCPYVYAQFKRHPELYNDVWKKDRITE